MVVVRNLDLGDNTQDINHSVDFNNFLKIVKEFLIEECFKDQYNLAEDQISHQNLITQNLEVDQQMIIISTKVIKFLKD